MIIKWGAHEIYIPDECLAQASCAISPDPGGDGHKATIIGYFGEQHTFNVHFPDVGSRAPVLDILRAFAIAEERLLRERGDWEDENPSAIHEGHRTLGPAYDREIARQGALGPEKG